MVFTVDPFRPPLGSRNLSETQGFPAEGTEKSLSVSLRFKFFRVQTAALQGQIRSLIAFFIFCILEK